ncbi:MAG TPA: acetylornithine/succinylornithine family transaminase [Thermoanaerobaculia bacterium]|nr:acetylornithine/succinylornithine family transaminase [Thermoanaerobaculia bacterium]
MLLHDESPAAVQSREDAFLVKTYNRTPFHPRDGKGARLYDADGRAYWDLLGGIAVNVLGHRHPRLMKVMKDASLLHVSNLYYHPAQGILGEKLVRASGLNRAFFCNSGTEANEAALKFARLATKKTKLVALQESFHGRTLGALSLTGHDAYREPFAPLVPGVSFVAPNDVAALEAAVDGDTAAIFLEPVMGEGGIVPLTDEYLIAARKTADRHGALLVLDEIQCGLGRTGTLFAFQQSGIVPDIVTLAKPLGGGLPLGAVLTGDAIEGAVKPGHHGTTFGGNPVACRLGAIVLEETEKLLPRINALGEWFGAALRKLDVGEVRGSGLMWGIELDRPASPVARELLDHGFIVGTAREKVLRLLPPYNVPKKALIEFMETLGVILSGAKDLTARNGEDPSASPRLAMTPRHKEKAA